MRKKVDAKMDLPSLEESVLDYWDKNKIFEKSIENRKNAERYSFYDGPPFATGTPHYGHIVASTMKDSIPRYWTMKGYYIPRVWGWDCHGLPIENIAEKELGLKTKKDIEKIGVKKFNEFCRSKVLEYADEWKVVMRRLGRWADMDNPYKTMDRSYMESVWWVFKQLWEKGLIYEDYRSLHVCPRCETTLSQSEVTEGYQMIKDLSCVAKFHLRPSQKWADGRHEVQDSTYILAWTTTPWTLIGNVALAVGKDIKYTALRQKDQKGLLILASDRVKFFFQNDEIEIVYDDITGKDLVGLEYEPLFDYYADNGNLENKQNGWRVYEAPFVTTDEGTGVVHIAPAFGEDDMILGKAENLPFVQHVGMDGLIKPEAGQFAGMNVKPKDDHFRTDVEIIKYLSDKGLLFAKEKFEHSYPHCWRCDTPLLNYATTSWFVKVTALKDEALHAAKPINWSPSHIKKGRFGKWLEGARDWSISRQRFWASVIPIWRCECGETKVIGSVKELEELSGQRVDDLHKHVIDEVSFACSKCGSMMHRLPDVLDTWFDSGSMPYAQVHYPFENKEEFENAFPAEFIGEGVDQTRAWFYYLHVISTAIFGQAAYKNVIVNGIVLAEDGKKMSKRLQNYPDPMEMFHKYGADVVRYYLQSSPVVAAENLNFSEKEMAQISRGMFRMLWNSYYFFTMYSDLDGWHGTWQDYTLSENILDKWIVSEIESLTQSVNKSMKRYDLVKSTRVFAEFMDQLSNWYIRRSRKRFWKSESDVDKYSAYATLNYVLVKLSLLMAPFCPFISEEIYRNLTGTESVHLEDYPEANEGWINPDLAKKMQFTRETIEKLLSIRDSASIKVRQPLAAAEYVGEQLPQELMDIICEEVNIKSISNVLKLKYKSDADDKTSLDLEITHELKIEGMMRDLVREIQVLRKESGFEVQDRIVATYNTVSPELMEMVKLYSKTIKNETLAVHIDRTETSPEGAKKLSIGGEKISILLEKSENA